VFEEAHVLIQRRAEKNRDRDERQSETKRGERERKRE